MALRFKTQHTTSTDAAQIKGAGRGKPFLLLFCICLATALTGCSHKIAESSTSALKQRNGKQPNTMAQVMDYADGPSRTLPNDWAAPIQPRKVNNSPTDNPSDEQDTQSIIDDKQNLEAAHLVLQEYEKWLGTPYRSGGTSRRTGFDCSGFTMTFYHDVLDIQLIHSSRAQFEKNCRKEVDKKDLTCGDLVFFVTNGKKVSRANINHVGIYLQDGRFIHSSTRGGVRIDRLDAPYYLKTWVTGGRVF